MRLRPALIRTAPVAVALAAAAVTLAPTPAQAAAPECKTTKREPPLPNKPDVDLKVRICVRLDQASSGYRWYEAYVDRVDWDGTSFYTGGKRFNSLRIKVRLEHNNDSKDSATENVTSDVNGSEADYRKAFADKASVRTRSKQWTADGVISFDAANDGRGTQTRQLTGTKSVT
ncbi:hypothetical protein [Streptomyces sp. NBC_01304]|uniref:hypothetical protein n=1 Tax=Streptomyces sp. NBC_01304 TaxID=2903818 RepID=UPI002E10AE87|nr:hypothetical protein OG430_40830 [Streptomyces sp. NBC_01304]